MRRILSLLFLLTLLLHAAPGAQAQQRAASVTLYNVDVSRFPTITGFVDVTDSRGIFASGLTPEQVTVIENGQPLPADSLTEMAIPIQLVVSVNQGAALDARNANGFSRFQRVAQVIAQWAQSRPPDLPDDLSLVSQTGPVINHANAADFIVGLTGFQPDMRNARPNLQSLSSALDVVTAQTPRIGMKRVILFITPQMDDPNLASTLEPLIQRAVENNVRVFVWYVDSNTTFTTTSAAVFNNLAIQTGGSAFQYSGEERFPDLEAYFSALRRIYLLSYTSRVNASGEHTLAVRANPAFGVLDSEPLSFSLDIQPPNAFPVVTTLQITRQAPADDPFNTEVLLPETQEIEIIIEFPDGYPRPLARTTLYVDGAVADENTAEPFDKFTWDLRAYHLSGEHQVVIEAMDALGLSRASMPIPVTVTVVKPPSGPQALLAKYRTQLTFASILLAGLVLFLILLSGRFRIPTLRAAQEERRAYADPVTQPIPAAAGESPSPPPVKKPKRRKTSKNTEAGSKSKTEAAASLARLTPDGQFAASSLIPLIKPETVFGTDPVQCTQILDDPSISPVHARLRVTEDGGYLLLDGGSIGGTWVNYEPVGREGYRLAHGDMVNFGQLSFRFMLKSPPPAKSPRVVVLPAEE
jgi:hypothetical protein